MSHSVTVCVWDTVYNRLQTVALEPGLLKLCSNSLSSHNHIKCDTYSRFTTAAPDYRHVGLWLTNPGLNGDRRARMSSELQKLREIFSMQKHTLPNQILWKLVHLSLFLPLLPSAGRTVHTVVTP